jgi:hypothetical protein
LKQELGSLLVSHSVSRFSEGGAFEGATYRYEINGPVSEDLADKIREACHPLDPVEMAQLLTRLKVKTSSNKPAGDLDMEFQIYAEDLMAYPADIVREVLKTQPDHHGWWPNWKMLRDRLEPMAANRLAMRDAINA